MNVAGWIESFRSRAISERWPLSGMLELTSRCNLQCVHCYLGPQEEQRAKRDQEMDTARVLSMIDDFVAGGCLYLLITGGDPMVRKDFPEIYRHAREQGLIVTVFCDGILVDDKIVDLFRDCPPLSVEISLYGATAATYEAITRVPGSYPRCLRGIRRLLDGGIDVRLKTVLMSINRHELEAMRQIARDFEVPFKTDNAIFPCLPTHDHSPLELRIPAAEAVELEMSDPEVLENWVGYVAAREHLEFPKTLYACGAGVTSFYVDPMGFASPCLMTTHHRFELGEGEGFASRWANELVQHRQAEAPEGYACTDCELKVACSGCPAFNFLENGAEDQKSEYVCETTRHRWDRIQIARSGVAEPAREARRAACQVVTAPVDDLSPSFENRRDPDSRADHPLRILP